jgi:hypothetical protein
MSNQNRNNNNNNNNNNKGVAEGIKETAGAAFHTIHSALETTEDIAMNAVDATKNVVNNVTGNENDRRARNNR